MLEEKSLGGLYLLLVSDIAQFQAADCNHPGLKRKI